MSTSPSMQYITSLPRRVPLLVLSGILVPMLLTTTIWGGYLSYSLDILDVHVSSARLRIVHDALGFRLQTHARQEATRIDTFFIERLTDARTVASDPLLIAASIQGRVHHHELGFHTLTIDQVESEVQQRAGVDRKLSLFPDLDLFLRQYHLSNPFFLEMFVTDRDGYNVASSSPTTDFVQRDEAWWKSAWTTGLFVGPVEYDTSAGAYSVDIAVRIDDPSTGQGVGVLKSVLGIRRIQSMLDRSAESIPGLRISLFNSTGQAIADTASDHASDLIMSEAFQTVNLGDSSLGYLQHKGALIGYSRTGGSIVYGSIAPRFTGLGWTIQIKLPEGDPMLVSSFDPFVQSFSQLRLWPWLLIGAVLLSTGAACGLTMFLLLSTIRRLRTSISLVADACDVAPLGEVPSIPSPLPYRDVAPLVTRARGLRFQPSSRPPDPRPTSQEAL